MVLGAYLESSHIWVGSFLQKQLIAKSRELFWQKGSIIDVRLGS